MNPDLLAKNIKILRKSRGWTMIFVAHQLRVSLSAYNRMENCQSSSIFYHINDFSKIYDITEFDLLFTEFHEELKYKTQ